MNDQAPFKEASQWGGRHLTSATSSVLEVGNYRGRAKESAWSSCKRLGLCLTGVGISQRSRQGISGRGNSSQRPGAGDECSIFGEPYAVGVEALSPEMGVMKEARLQGQVGWGHGRPPTAKGGVQVTPRALLSWNSSITDSLLRNMFPANLVEATFKQVSGFLGTVVGRASLGLAWLVSLPVSGGGMLQERVRGKDLDL